MAANTSSSTLGTYLVLLELRLLDVQQLMQPIGGPVAVAASRSAPAAAAASAQQSDALQQQQGQQGDSGQLDTIGVAGPEVVLSVVVSAAVNLPMVPG